MDNNPNDRNPFQTVVAIDLSGRDRIAPVYSAFRAAGTIARLYVSL
jgi:hypothetical protein